MKVNPFVAIPNPFRQSIVKDAWESLKDVPEIHVQAFTTPAVVLLKTSGLQDTAIQCSFTAEPEAAKHTS